MRARTLGWCAAIVAACGIAAFVRFGRGGDDATATVTSPAPPRGEARPAVGARVDTAPAPSGPAARSPEPGAGAAPAVVDEAKNAPVDPTPATREEPLTAEERDPRMKRAVQMLDETVARTEKKLAEAEAAGDEAAAATARIRIAKLKEVRDLRARELEAKQ